MRTAQKWLSDEGIIYTGFWEPIYFTRQRGQAQQNLASRLDFLKSETYIAHLAEHGVNHLWCNFSKGYGLAFEQEEQLKIKDMCTIAHKYNMRVIAYCTGGTVVPETLKYDVANPDEIEGWLCKTEDGKRGSYGNGGFQCFRARPCYTSPDYLAWQEKVVTRALDYGCDGIHFDNTNVLPEPGSCKCARCVGLFREFVASKYNDASAQTKKAGIERWGRNDFDFVAEPWHDQWNPPILQREVHVANQQEWFLFRQHIFAKALKRWADFIHQRERAVEFNCGKGFHQDYRLFGSINDELILPDADMIFNEGTLSLGYNTAGSPHTRVRCHKIVQAFNVPMMNYNRSLHQLAEAFSFNPGMCGLWPDEQDPKNFPEKIKFFNFYHQYKHYQTRQTSVAETAFYLHNESITFSQLDCVRSLCSLTQLLQEENVPFNFIYNKDLNDLSHLKLIVLANMNSIKEAEAEKLIAWVKAGGSLITTEQTGSRDDSFQLRTKIKEIKTCEDLFAANEAENIFTPLSGENHQQDFISAAGKGMIAHIKQLEHAEKLRYRDTAEWQVTPAMINRPQNSASIMAVVRQLLPQQILSVSSSSDLLVDICKRDDSGEGLVHVVNVSFAKAQLASANVTLRWPHDINTLTWIGYDRDETNVAFEQHAEHITFTLPDIRESAVVIINKVNA